MDPRSLLEPKKQTKMMKSTPLNGVDVKNPIRSSNAPNTSTPSTPSRSIKNVPKASANTSPTALRTFDPKALLNPRGQRPAPTTQPVDNQRIADLVGASADRDTVSSRDNSATSGFAFLEQLHGTEKRMAERQVKKRKTEHISDEENKKHDQSAGSSRHGNAGVGEYFKPKPVADASGTIPPMAAIDLTNDDDDDDDDDDDAVQITGVRNIDDKEVCYGMIDGYIQAHKVPKPEKNVSSQLSSSQWPVFKINLARRTDRGMTIECTDFHGIMFGHIEEALANALAPAMDGFSALRTQCRVLSRSRKQNEETHQQCSDRYRIIINLYGRKADSDKVGRWFGQKNIWFKAPLVSDSGIPLENPHAAKRAAIQPKSSTPRPVTNITRTVEEAATAVSRLFDHQAREGSEFTETEPPSTIVTPLLPHQKQSLTFMLRQEKRRTFDIEEAGNSSLWRKKINHRGQNIYEDIVTGIEVMEEPPQALGGLLADVMGLGKTIQALALIASTAIEAQHFGLDRVARAAQGEEEIKCNSRATLLVAPVSTVKNWEDQIKEHTKPASMLYHVYHGSNRLKQCFKLADNDVVITTYSTAAYELFGKNNTYNAQSPLRQIRWFRIILDEAHTIRESKSSQARAMYSLHAQRRWCLTGTPIQNRMEDLGSLTIFLRLFPYDSLARFKQYIQGPTQSGDPSFLKRLRVFVDSFTLRRLRDRIDLPNRQDLTVNLEFTEAERKLHDFFREKFSVAVKEMGQKNKRGATGAQYHRVLKGITILRLICDHGKELLKQDQLDEYKGSMPDDAIDVDEEQPPAFITKRQAFEHFSLLVEGDADFCVKCNRKFTGDSPDSPTDEVIESSTDLCQAIVLPCFDTICTDCFVSYREQINSAKAKGETIRCDLCLASISPTYVALPKTYADDLQTMPEDGASERSLFKNGFYTGPHTKTKVLLDDIKEMQKESFGLSAKGEPPLKCVVFSEFTSHLDLIEKALSDAGFTSSFRRIDGSMSLASRRKVLDALNDDNSVTILLASIKAAGQGLNLTAASRAFIMEPMWNPAAESQAVDRIYRIGQKREVIVKRYRMTNSIEDKILELQNKKKKLAEISMERAAMHKALSKKERSEQSLKAMIDIFKS